MVKNIRGFCFGWLCIAMWVGVVSGGDAQNLADLLDKETDARNAQPAQPKASERSRQAVPNSAQLRDANQKIRDAFMLDARSAPSADAKTSLASQLLALVDEEPEAATRYALTQAALKLAGEAGAVDLVKQAIEKVSAAFEVDEFQLQVSAYTRIAIEAPPDKLGAVVDELLRIGNVAVAGGRFNDAESVIKQAVAAARRAKDRTRQGAAVQIMNELRSRRKAADRLQPFLDRLKANPLDQEAALEVGTQWCFREGRWKDGLPYLARSGNEAIAAAAKAELDAGSGGGTKLAAAELWQAALASAAKSDKLIIGQHAVELYSSALPGLTGLAKVKTERAIEEIQATLPKSALEAGWQVIFRGSDAGIWDTDTQDGMNRFAVKLADVPNNIGFLRMRNSAGETVIIPMSKENLGKMVRGTNYVWAGHKQVIYGTTLLGIGDRSANIMGKPGVAIYVETGEWLTGYGIGPSQTHEATPAWENNAAAGTTIEISVATRPLLPAERKFLLNF